VVVFTVVVFTVSVFTFYQLNIPDNLMLLLIFIQSFDIKSAFITLDILFPLSSFDARILFKLPLLNSLIINTKISETVQCTVD